jgi:hypothetical protein
MGKTVLGAKTQTVARQSKCKQQQGKMSSVLGHKILECVITIIYMDRRAIRLIM